MGLSAQNLLRQKIKKLFPAVSSCGSVYIGISYVNCEWGVVRASERLLLGCWSGEASEELENL